MKSGSYPNRLISAGLIRANVAVAIKSISPHSRPRTPPRPTPSGYGYRNSSAAQSVQPGGKIISSTRQPYAMFLSQSQGDWNNATDDKDNDDDEISYDENDEEDEFGLPSIASVHKRKDRGIQQFPIRGDYPAGPTDTHLDGSPTLTSGPGSRRLRRLCPSHPRIRCRRL